MCVCVCGKRRRVTSDVRQVTALSQWKASVGSAQWPLGSQQKVPLLRHPPCQLGLRATSLPSNTPPPLPPLYCKYLAQSAETPSGETRAPS